MQLSTEDKERIHREARNKTNDHYQSKLSAEIANDAYYKGYKVGAEYATIYERQKQANLLAKVSEQEKEIELYREELKHLMERRDYWKDLAESKLNEVSEQSQRIQQLEGLLKHLHNSGYISTKQRERIKAALNL